MISSALQFIKRGLAVVPGMVIAWLVVRNLFPDHIGRRLPLAVAIFLTYLIGAYVLIPALIRLVRLVHSPKHLPMYCVTPDGYASDPLNITLLGKRQQLIDAMLAAGWSLADDKTIASIVRHGLSVISGRPYAQAPVSTLYLFGRKHDLAFQIPLEDSRGGRHHVRFWRVVRSGHLMWVGAASLDTGVGLISHNAQITHFVHPDTNQERQFIVNSLEQAGWLTNLRLVKLGNPYRLVNRVWRAYFHSDGQMAIAELKPPAT